MGDEMLLRSIYRSGMETHQQEGGSEKKIDRREGLRVDKWGKRIALDGGNQCENTSEGGSVCERETLSLCGSSVADLCLFNFNLVT